MLRSKYILPAIIIVLLMMVYFYQSKTSASSEIEYVEIPEKKVYTKFDSLVFEFDSILSHKVDSFKTVGSAVAVSHKGKIAYLRCFGVKKNGSRDSIDENTIFRLASVSKTITGVLAGILSEEKIIGLDDRVIDYLPGFKLKDSVNTHDLTIRHILSHTSGLVPHAYDNLVEAQVPYEEIMDSLFRVNISAEPGILYGYQNVVFSLYDTIARAKTGKEFDDLLKEKLFGPIGMNQASAGFQNFEGNPNKAFPHRGPGGNYKTLPLNDRYYNTNPAAGINASISDMARFLLVLSGNDSADYINRVTGEVLSPQVVSPLRWNYLRRWDGVESKHYGLGWRIIGYEGRQIAYHGGYVQGYQAEIALCREEELGIIYLSNSPNGLSSKIVPMFLEHFIDSEKMIK